MASKKISPDQLDSAIAEILEEYAGDLTEGLNQASKQIADYGRQELKDKAQASGIKGKKYFNSFRAELLSESPFGNTYVIKSTKYRIAHLLEHGHIVVSHGKYTGKRTRAFHHWTQVEEDTSKKLEAVAKQQIEKANRG